MVEHASELIPFLMALLGFFAVYTLNGIKGEIKEVKLSLRALEKDMSDGVAALEHRVTVVEARCCVRHAE